MSNSIQIGRVRPFKSEQYDWTSTYQYEVLELVRYDTITYLCTKVPPVGTLPTNETYFVRLGSDVSIATSSDTGLVKVDGTTITITEDGTISVAGFKTARAIDGVSFDGNSDIIHYASCSTAAGTAAKVATISGFKLATGARATIKFTNTNSAANPTLNISDTGAKAIYYGGVAVTANFIEANSTYELVYNGTQYDIVGSIDKKVLQTLSTTNAEYPLLGKATNGTSTVTDGSTFAAGVTINPSAKSITATTFKGSLSGNADTANNVRVNADENTLLLVGGKVNNAYINTDSTPTANSSNLITSGAVHSFVATTVENAVIPDGTTIEKEDGTGTITAKNIELTDGTNLIVNDKVKVSALPVVSGATSSTAGTAGLVPAPAAGDNGKFLSGDGTYKTIDLTNLNASNLTSGTIPVDRLPEITVSANNIDGVIPVENLPASALERLVKVTDQAARFALTTSSVQLGDTVLQTDTGMMYLVVDTTKLSSEDGYQPYTAVSATSVPWSGITDKPSTYTPSTHTHTMSQITDYSVPTDITGNAGTSSKWASQMTLNLTGNVTGSASFDGSTTASMTTTVASVPSSALPTATTSALGGVKVDGSSIVISDGVISSANVSGVQTWVTTTEAGKQTYEFTGAAFPSNNTNEYILAYGAAVLDPEDYSINTTNNSITLGATTETADLKLRLYHFRSGYAEADGSNYWSVQQQSNGIVDQSFLANNAITGNLSVTKQTPSAVTMTTSGARSVTVTAAGVNESKFITLVLKASAATTMTWNGITKWVDKDEAAPSWGNSGATLVVQLALVGGVVLASTLYNSQA